MITSFDCLLVAQFWERCVCNDLLATVVLHVILLAWSNLQNPLFIEGSLKGSTNQKKSAEVNSRVSIFVQFWSLATLDLSLVFVSSLHHVSLQLQLGLYLTSIFLYTFLLGLSNLVPAPRAVDVFASRPFLSCMRTANAVTTDNG